MVGDAVCSFNPIYGQGMSVAALEALTLRRHLARGVEPQSRRWFRDLARLVDVPWQMAAGGDLVFPGVEGRRTRKTRLMGNYIARLHAAAAHDPTLPPPSSGSPGWSPRPGPCCVPASPVRGAGGEADVGHFQHTDAIGEPYMMERGP